MNEARGFDQAVKANGAGVWLTAWRVLIIVLLSVTIPAGLQAQSSQAPQPMRETVQTIDRAYGLQLGDQVTRRIRVRGKALAFAPEHLPEPGPVSAWLNLLSIKVDEQADDAGKATWLTLRYQITGAAPTVTLVELPVLRLLGQAGDQAPALARLDAVPVSVSPIIGERPFQRLGMGDLQPEALVPLAPRARWERLMWVMSALALMLLVLALLRLWWRQRPGHQAPFTQALLSIGSANNLREAYQHLHRAFDRTARHTVMADDLPGFISANPAYGALRPEIEAFFSASREQFFKQSVPPVASAQPTHQNPEFTTLLSIARQLAHIEKGLL